MADVLIRDLPDGVVAALDAKADRLGLSRTELLRRSLERESKLAPRSVAVADFRRAERQLADVLDSEVMSDAWS